MNRNRIGRMLLGIIKSIALPVLIFVVFAILTKGRTSTSRMVLTTLRQSVVPMLLCWGLMMTMSMGMINFAGGAIILATGIIGGNLAMMTGSGLWGMLLFCCLISVVICTIIGFLYNKLRVPCMVLTIGLMLILESLPRTLFAGGVRISGNMVQLAMSPGCFIIAAVMLLLFYIIYEKTAFGHNMRALGANASIAANVGLDADKIKIKAFVISGLFFGAAAAVYVSANGEVRNVGALGSMQIMMDGFMGMFLAMFMSRFCSLAFAVPISAFSMRMITNGFVSLGLDGTARDLTNGLFLLVLLAVAANSGLFDRIKADKAFTELANKEDVGAT